MVLGGHTLGWGASLIAVVAVAGCHRATPASRLERLEPFAGEWRCPMDHLTATDATARHVMQHLTIAREPEVARYAVRFSPERDAPSPEAVTSVAYWSYDEATHGFTSGATVGEGETAASEQYASPGPLDGKLVWTGELRSAISTPMRMAFTRSASRLDILVEAFADEAWKPLSTAACTPARTAS